MRSFLGTDWCTGKAWAGPNITEMPDAVVKLRWTDQPFHWHVNRGEEVFAVLAGTVDMHIRDSSGQRTVQLDAGDVLHLVAGEEHVAHPRGAARLLVIERAEPPHSEPAGSAAPSRARSP